jgi:hypothetical protein
MKLRLPSFRNANRRYVTILLLVPVIAVSGAAGIISRPQSQAAASVPGESYQICGANAAQYLTSPYTYNALASGVQSYTVSQYQALLSGGASLPPLPAYISGEGGSAPAAKIYAPGATVNEPAYANPETPIIHFYEGGAYGFLAEDSVSGDEFIGGSATGYAEPQFDQANGAGGINAQNGSFYYSGGTSTLAASASAGATAITTTATIPGYITWFTFADGSSYRIATNSGTSITLSNPLTTSETAGQQVWANSTQPIANLVASYAQGATTINLTGSSIPIIQWQQVNIGDHSYNVTAVSGSQSGGYTITINGLDIAGAANTPVYYSDLAGGVTVSYLDIAHDSHNTTGTIYTGTGWTVTHNNIHDGYMNSGGTPTPGLGVAIYGGDQGDIEYNCLSKMGDYGVNIFGTNDKFDHNEVTESNYEPDPGCGCSGGGKWWGTLNADIVANSFINTSPGGGAPIWFDNGNSGSLVQDNYFYKSVGGSVESETGFNLDITNNLFVDSGWGTGTGGCGDNCNGQINLNSSGGFHVPGSRYDNEILVSGNTFIDDWQGLDIWESGARNCMNSGESYGNGDDSPYCSGGFPNTSNNSAANQYYFSHIADTPHGGANYALDANAAAGATTVLVNGSVATNDQLGFADPIDITTTSTTNVTSLTGSQTINASSTAGFPSSGQLRVATSAAWGGPGDASWTGAILSYTGTTPTSFTGVSLVRGAGSLTGGIEQVQPYKATSEICYANDCKVTITPALTSSESIGTSVTNSGTCQLFATAAATPTSPLAPDGTTSYYDGCQWRNNNISITGNAFSVDPAAINAGTTLNGSTPNCTAGNNCGINFEAFQEAGEAPFSSFTDGNSMLSNSLTSCPTWDAGCTTNPLKNINALSNPPNATAHNNEPAENIMWTNNAYYGSLWVWHTYWFGTCGQLPSDPTNSASMPSGACNVDFSHWQSDWQQDTNSTYSSTPNPNPPPPGAKTGDFNNDGFVNITDLSMLLSAWGTNNSTILTNLNQTGVVNITCLSIFLSHWGT